MASKALTGENYHQKPMNNHRGLSIKHHHPKHLGLLLKPSKAYSIIVKNNTSADFLGNNNFQNEAYDQQSLPSRETS